MNLTLTNIETNERLSEETLCYSATLKLDGRKVAELSNHGHGGCDNEHWSDTKARDAIHAYFKTLPIETVDIGGGRTFDLQPDLERWAHGVVADHVTLKSLKRTMSRKVVGLVGGLEYAWNLKAVDLDKPVDLNGRTVRQSIEAKNPGVVFLNGMSDADLLKALATVRA